MGGVVDADIDAFEAWDISTGDADTVRAVIDSEVQWSCPDLDSNVWSNIDETAGNGLDDDNNGQGVGRVLRDAQVISIPVRGLKVVSRRRP